jgi:hypothetical protein
MHTVYRERTLSVIQNIDKGLLLHRGPPPVPLQTERATARYFYGYEICFYGIYIYGIYFYRALKFLNIVVLL